MLASFDFLSRNSWLPYVATKEAQKAIGIEVLEKQTFQLTSPSMSTKMRSMLSIYELGLLYGLARNYWSARGAIIDAGPLMGATTFAFARGLADNGRIEEAQKHNAIYSFDLFIRDEYYSNFLQVGADSSHTPTILHKFIRINRDYIDYIVPHQGDFLQWMWPNAPIEILFMDLAKDWKLNAHYIKTMFPKLVPDGIVIQQDYVHFNEYWIHLTMEYFSDYFEFCDVMYGATAYFRVLRPLTREMCMVDLEALPFGRKMELLASAKEKMPFGVQQVMKSAAAKCAVENGQFRIAQELLDTVIADKVTSNPVDNVSGIARSNRDIVQGMLDKALQRAAAST